MKMFKKKRLKNFRNTLVKKTNRFSGMRLQILSGKSVV